MSKKAIIIGAGPAGLTAGFELLKKTGIKPVIFELTEDIGGISKTINYKGNRIDIGGHRFFSKSDKVMNWWQSVLPITEEAQEKTMLKRSRLSRIFFERKFYDYPVSLNFNTLKNLGLWRIFKIGFSYSKARLLPQKENSLEDFMINRFGKELYLTFFKDYTEKVWGVPCDQIEPEWGKQRIKGLSISKAIIHSLKSFFKKNSSISQKNIETSLIDQFLYPKYGPGQLWEEVASLIKAKGGEVYLNHQVIGLQLVDHQIKSVQIKDQSGQIKEFEGDYFFTTMPVKELINSFSEAVPAEVKKIANGLVYRDFITVGLLLKDLKINQKGLIKDNWIYIQEKDINLGRIQVFNNWSPYLVKNKDNFWIGLEYFCNQGDELWNMSDLDFKSMAINELIKIGFINKEDVLDSIVIKMPKAYPAYFGTYSQFDQIQKFTDQITNLFLIGRNGMHKYNNMDHSMLTAMAAVDNIINNIKNKDNIWQINAEQDYHEEE